ncbi:hypothetical protein HW115_01475 [Verrucomicrobiaceae bacterium N1E253]|uniref:Uncharacterized protein n=1 Tax=Oceaniferula marina TaxID=2748318 RepID=A0A851GG70_9BACT|nr:hypothetical protein [Oceaniferula marina]NWK54265.1 hypothetical protein [Oceaniferula marina]
MKTSILILTSALSIFIFSSCNEKQSESVKNAGEPSKALQAIVLKEAPADALSIAEARKDPTPGKSVVLRGKVMGNLSPIVSGRAMVLIGDPDKLTSCDLKNCSDCQTPWDVCCDDLDDRKNYTVTVQVLDTDGKLLKEGLRGVQGLKELSEIVVEGEISEGSNTDNFLVNATGIYVQP